MDQGNQGKEAADYLSERLKLLLRELEKNQGVSQTSFAAMSGVDKAAISNIVRLGVGININNLRRLAIALDVDSDYLIGLSDIPKKVDASEYSDEQKRLLAFIEARDYEQLLKLLLLMITLK